MRINGYRECPTRLKAAHRDADSAFRFGAFSVKTKSSGKRLVTVKGLIKASAGKAEIVGGTAELVASSLFCGAELIFFANVNILKGLFI